MFYIILAIPRTRILEFKEGKITEVKYQETEHYQLTKLFWRIRRGGRNNAG